MQLKASELVLNADNSIYHLNIVPEDLADTIITVGDPDRVPVVSKYFDTIEVKKGKREFHTHTGTLNGKRISVISTGIGTDNIDIVLNELDALVNINFDTRTINEHKKQLDIIRIGTTGAIQPNIEVGDFLLSERAIGFDSLLRFYDAKHILDEALQNSFMKHTDWSKDKSTPYVVSCDHDLAALFMSDEMHKGFTATNVGFYGPQGRKLRLKTEDENLNAKLASFDYKGLKITNLEMETSGIYGLAKLLGHRAVSLNCILANRSTGEFLTNPTVATEKLIKFTLNKLTE
ncbi:purine or other phosphorylase family 1 [Cellulophaga algicola DSM 14237]|uniref:Uridine phosphorylase n=1 Tax=Cellulophaga algicola (strain DSM 14237 / IC166 / ACAM 630) TaxID=688270 RepID=E6XBG5_CELAD|nr:nucleoside phosphorylase [Cellulophaga algicola]ADV51078.1 purine or other phosphorylase family 1 [Cellulophaga algicola DSM 14237]